MESFDAAVIGGGVLGCFAARELTRWSLSVALLEAREDVCTGITRANTAIIYPGYDHKPGTLKAEMTVRANARMEQLCRELDVPFFRCGSLMLSYGARADAVLRKKYRDGLENGVPGLRLLDGKEAEGMEPSLAHGVRSALYAPTAGTVNPWELGIAAFENACRNGAVPHLNTTVLSIGVDSDGYLLETNRGVLRCRGVVNCAGLASDRVQELAYPSPVHIAVTAGDYLILSKNAAHLPRHILQLEPEDGGKGVAVVPTPEGSVLVGPSERENEIDYAADRAGLSFVRSQLTQLLPETASAEIIRSFAAARPNPQLPDGGSIRSFVIEHPAPAFWSLIGIKTPGLTCAEELGRHVAEQLADTLGAEENPAFDPYRTGIRRARGLNVPQRAELVREQPDHGEVVCLCEDVTKAEVLEAIRRGAVTLDGIKRRVGAGMGDCQSSRCRQTLIDLLAKELGVSPYAVRKDGAGSEILGGKDDTL